MFMSVCIRRRNPNVKLNKKVRNITSEEPTCTATHIPIVPRAFFLVRNNHNCHFHSASTTSTSTAAPPLLHHRYCTATLTTIVSTKSAAATAPLTPRRRLLCRRSTVTAPPPSHRRHHIADRPVSTCRRGARCVCCDCDAKHWGNV